MPSQSSLSSDAHSEHHTAAPPVKVDPKLFHLVKKIVSSQLSWDELASTSSSASSSSLVRTKKRVDGIVTLLRKDHREYLRKDLDRLTAQVNVAVSQILQQREPHTTSASQPLQQSNLPVDAGSNDSNSVGRKRKNRDNRRRDEQDDREEEVYDQEAKEHDLLQQHQLDVTNGGSLNAVLRHRYRQVNLSTSSVGAIVDDGTADAASGQLMKQIKTTESEPIASSVDPTLVKSPKLKRKIVRRSSSALSMGLPGSNNSDAAFLSPVPRPTERYSDLGGIDRTIKEVRQLVEYPLLRPELYRHLGIDPPRGVLLRGPPGTGKSHFANAVAGELGIPYFRVSAPELVSGMSGESEGRIRELFTAASGMAPALIFLDEIDCIAPKRGDSGNSRGMEKRMVAQLLTCLDLLAPQNNRNQAAVMVLAATNRPESLDAALRRAGRFDKEIMLGVPDEDAREQILRTMTKKMRLSGDFDFRVLARKTPGFVGADVHSLAKEAAVLAISRIFRDVLNENADESDDPKQSDVDEFACGRTPLTPEQMQDLCVTMDDFLHAVPLVQPSSKREGFATVPDVTWSDVGALQSIREELTLSVLEPIRCPEKFHALGLSLPAGVLLYGPPGCGKTLLAKAIANESGANFISVKGPELLDKYVGESERAVRLVFERARSSSPCIVFFDELDSLVPRRGSDSSGGGGVSERVVNQLLTELDGLDSRRSVFVIAATNRPELIDPAMLRPGRLDKLLYVPLPTPEDRVAILKALSTNVSLGGDVDLDSIGRSSKANGYSGADCAALLREAGLAVLKEGATATLRICASHFNAAFRSVMPSVSKKDEIRYNRIRDRMARSRSRRDDGPESEDVDDNCDKTT